MWCKVDREVNKCPHKTLAFLKANISVVMTELDSLGRLSIMPARSSTLGLRLLWRPLEFSLIKCVHYMYINFS
jgi:hypothetical protein